MFSLVCNCGYETKGPDRYMVEAQMWQHAMGNHLEQLKGMKTEQIVQWLKDKDKTLASQKK